VKVLGIDTSGYANAIGVADGNRILADFTFEARNDSLEKIVANIDFTLKEANLALEDIKGFGVGLGPGSWTGIRVGVTVAKILAFSANKPVTGVPTLEVLAYNARNMPGVICPIINAGAGDTIYAAFYRTTDGTVSRVGEYYVGDIQGLSEMVKEPTTFVGAEARTYRHLIRQALGSPNIALEAVEGAPRGVTVALLAATRLERGENDDVLSLAPLYLKESTAKAFVNKYSRSAQAKSQV
jgi:tRNA threonylcarbamoyladenosine biosynthesis protein TsaB